MAGTQYLYLLTLLVIPGLLAFLLLMEYLESRFVQRIVADDIARLLGSSYTVDDLEASIAASAEPLFVGVRGRADR